MGRGENSMRGRRQHSDTHSHNEIDSAPTGIGLKLALSIFTVTSLPLAQIPSVVVEYFG